MTDYVPGNGKQWIAGDQSWEDVSRGHCLTCTATLCRPGHIGGCKCPCGACREAVARIARYNTVLTVHAKDGTERDVAICEEDTAETIGKTVIAAIHGTKLFQLSTRIWPERAKETEAVIERVLSRNGLLR